MSIVPVAGPVRTARTAIRQTAAVSEAPSSIEDRSTPVRAVRNHRGVRLIPSHSTTRSLVLVAAVLGVSTALNTQSDAAVVALDLAAIGISGVNAGLSTGNFTIKPSSSFIPGTTQNILFDNYGIGGSNQGVLGFGGGAQFVIRAATPASPRNFGSAMFIDDGTSMTGGGIWSAANAFFRQGADVSANFGPSSYMGFRIQSSSNPSEFFYGYFEVTWDGTNFEFLSGAYESTANVGIWTPSAVPGGAGLVSLAFGAVGLRGRRRR